MPNIQDAFPSKYLKASDLHDTEPIVTIDKVAFELVGRDKEKKAILYFRGKDKGLVLNKTNANKITELLGSAITEEWNGKRIKLYATETTFGADIVDCIRVKAAQPRPNGDQPVVPPPPPPAREPGVEELNDDDIPF